MITHTGFFGDGDHVFALTDPMLIEIERLTGQGIGAIYQRAVAMAFSASDLVEIIRLGLIGGGMAPQQAMTLTDTYARNRPLAETYPLALDILDARWNGTTAPATGDTTE
jgi:hypothetical protein